MNNKILMERVIKLDTETLTSRIHSQKNQLQLSVIRKAFGVKNGETNLKVENFERERVMTNEQIIKNFKQYTKYLEYTKTIKNEYKEIEANNSIKFYIEAVQFFDMELAEILKGISQKIKAA